MATRFSVSRLEEGLGQGHGQGPGQGPGCRIPDVPEHGVLEMRRHDTAPALSGQTVDSNDLRAGDLFSAASTTCLYDLGRSQRRRSFVHLTREALPRLDNYRQHAKQKRPSLGDLHDYHGSGVSKLTVYAACLLHVFSSPPRPATHAHPSLRKR